MPPVNGTSLKPQYRFMKLLLNPEQNRDLGWRCRIYKYDHHLEKNMYRIFFLSTSKQVRLDLRRMICRTPCGTVAFLRSASGALAAGRRGSRATEPGGRRKLGAGGDDLDLLPPSNSQPGLSHFK